MKTVINIWSNKGWMIIEYISIIFIKKCKAIGLLVEDKHVEMDGHADIARRVSWKEKIYLSEKEGSLDYTIIKLASKAQKILEHKKVKK